MFIKRFVLNTTLVLSGVLGSIFVSCSSGGGGGDPKPPPPPPPVVYHTINVSSSSAGMHLTAPAPVKDGDPASVAILLDSGWTDPVMTANPAVSGTLSQGVTANSYLWTIQSVKADLSVTGSATPPPALYSISGKVTGGVNGVTLTLSTGKTVATDVNGNYIFVDAGPSGNYVVTINLPPGWVSNPSGARDVGVNNADSVGNDFVATFTSPFVNAEIAVLRNGDQCIVFREQSSYSGNVVKAAKYTSYKKYPGSSDFVLLGQGTRTQDLPPDSILSAQLTDVVPLASIEGTVFKVEIEELVSGLKTSVITTVSSEEKFQAVALGDGRSIKITFPGNSTPFVVHVYKMVYQWPIRYLSAPVFSSQDGVIVVPEGYPTAGSPVVVNIGYPNAVSYTGYAK
jgi:hypothetical protein